MNSLLEKQQVKKRRKVSSDQKPSSKRVKVEISRIFSRKGKTKAAFRPLGVISANNQNNRFVEKIKQEPAKTHREQVKKAQRPKEKKTKLPSFTVPAATALFMVMGLFLIINSHDGGFDWIGRQVVSPELEQNSQLNLARYVGINNENIPNSASNERSEELLTDSIPLDLTETFAWENYTVLRGDTVSGIAQKFAVSMDAIISSNGITNARTLREGEVLRIPNMDGIPYTVREGDTLSSISQSMGVPFEAILDANDLQSDVIRAGTNLFIPGARMNRDDLRLALGELFLYPVRGSRLSSPFGWRNDPFTGVRRHHAAIDLSAPMGTSIISAMDGRVSATGYDRTYGNFIILTHSGGFQTMYAHLQTIGVRTGDQVRQGVQIGTVGNTGYSTGPHLHFAVFRNGRAVNPLDFLSPQR
ncbi:MAG: M23 family metallopeptidase [Treponema sp.]|nr:M23 family metallopeptidase [Treponema sp.]